MGPFNQARTAWPSDLALVQAVFVTGSAQLALGGQLQPRAVLCHLRIVSHELCMYMRATSPFNKAMTARGVGVRWQSLARGAASKVEAQHSPPGTNPRRLPKKAPRRSIQSVELPTARSACQYHICILYTIVQY